MHIFTKKTITHNKIKTVLLYLLIHQLLIHWVSTQNIVFKKLEYFLLFKFFNIWLMQLIIPLVVSLAYFYF